MLSKATGAPLLVIFVPGVSFMAVPVLHLQLRVSLAKGLRTAGRLQQALVLLLPVPWS